MLKFLLPCCYKRFCKHGKEEDRDLDEDVGAQLDTSSLGTPYEATAPPDDGQLDLPEVPEQDQHDPEPTEEQAQGEEWSSSMLHLLNVLNAYFAFKDSCRGPGDFCDSLAGQIP